MVGWEDQACAVLLSAKEPLWTTEVGRLARVVPTGPYADADLAEREGGDPYQACYRVLVRLEKRGLVIRHYYEGDARVYWLASPSLRQRHRQVAAKLRKLAGLPAFGEE